MLYLFAAILLFGVLIAVHELGHFFAAKACGVRVNELAIGMGPLLLRKVRGETVYSLRLLPIGGFCDMEGEEEESEDPRSLSRQGFWKKFLIYVAGAAMNFLIGFLIMLVLYLPATAFYDMQIVELHENFPQQGESGVMIGDRIHSINGERIYVRSDIDLVFSLIERDENGTIEIVFDRGGEKLTRTLTLQTYLDEEGKEYRAYGFTYGGMIEATPLMKLRQSWYATIDYVRMVRMSMQMLFTGAAGTEDLSGPIGIVSTITQVGEEAEASGGVLAAFESIGYFAAMIAVNLAVMNLLPVPALDGGKVFFLLINSAALLLFKRQIPAKYENYIHGAGFALLMALMLYVTFNDVLKLI